MLTRPRISTRSRAGCGRSGTATTFATSRRSPREMVITSPSLTDAAGFAAAPLIRTRPASHRVCASVRRFTRRLSWRNLSNRMPTETRKRGNAETQAPSSSPDRLGLLPRFRAPVCPSFRGLVRSRDLCLSLDLFQPLLEGRFLPDGQQDPADLVTRLLERRRLRGPAVEDLDEMIAVLRLDNVRDLLGLQREGHLLKFGHQLPTADEPQVAALLATAGILGVLARQIIKRLATPQLRQHQSGLILVVQEDVLDVDLLGPVELVAVLAEVLLDLDVAHGGRRHLHHEIPHGQIGPQAILELGEREVALR